MAAKKPAKKPQSRAKSSHGGKRAGSGRKSKALSGLRENYRQITHDLIVARLPEVIDSLFVLALGHRSRDKEGEIIDVPPDRESCKALLDRVLGRPMQAVEVTGKGGGDLKIVIEYADHQAPTAEAPPGAGEDPGGDGPL